MQFAKEITGLGSLVTSDEIGELANTFNHMAAQLEDNIRNLNLEKEHLASVLRSMTDAVVTFDGEGKVILTNPPGEKIMQAWCDLDWAQGRRGAGSKQWGCIFPGGS